jgi:hypothetical protein
VTPLINTSDLTARAYHRRPPRYPVLTETLGLAVVLLAGRNTTRDRAVWLAHPGIDDVLCEAAEAFTQVLERRPPIAGWRGGALASLRSLVPGAVHVEQDLWPHTNRDPEPVERVWLDDLGRAGGRVRAPARDELAQRLAGRDGAERALTTLIANYKSHYALVTSWDSAHEDPECTRKLLDHLLGQRPGYPLSPTGSPISRPRGTVRRPAGTRHAIGQPSQSTRGRAT